MNPCHCGCTEKDILINRKCGCSHCYEHFRSIIDDFNINYHQATTHIGKKPKRIQTKNENLKLLKLQLAKAKELENFQLISQLVTKIRNLK